MQLIEIEGVPEEGPDLRILAASHALRQAVFVVEQRIPASLEWDEHDAASRHFVLLDLFPPDSTPSAAANESPPRAAGTARMRRRGREAKAERVAVRVDARRLGVGRALMRALEARARIEGLEAVVLHAQQAAVPFYEALGYTAHGPIFAEAGIDHRAMRRRLG